MEITSVASFLPYYEKIWLRTRKLVSIIPAERLEWAYAPGKFTLGDQVRHIAAISRYLFAEVAAGRSNAYKGCGPELAGDLPSLLAYFDEMHRQTTAVIAGIDDEALNKMCMGPGGHALPSWKWLRLMTEHEVHHRGQLYVYLGLLGIPTPAVLGMTAEQVQQDGSQQ